jgi:hypothetical protein
MLTRSWTGAVDLVHGPRWTGPKGYKALLIWTARRDRTAQMHQERQRRRETADDGGGGGARRRWPGCAPVHQTGWEKNQKKEEGAGNSPEALEGR